MTKKILLITDDAETLLVVQIVMMNKPVEFAHVDSLGQAAAVLRETVPDLLILDLTMKEPRVLTFLHRMKLRAQFEQMPVLVMVSVPDPVIIKEALDLGADRYLTKVFIAQNLSRTVTDMLVADNAG